MYKFKSKSSKGKIKISFFLLFFTVLLSGALFGVIKLLDRGQTPNISESIESTPEKYTEESAEAAVLPEKEENLIKSGLLKANYNYICGHTEQESREIPESYIGKTEKELLSEYPDITSCTYSNGVLNAEISINTKCSQHYIVKLNGNILEIYCEKFPERAEREMLINVRGLYEEEVEMLKKGIELGSKTEMLEFIEDFES